MRKNVSRKWGNECLPLANEARVSKIKTQLERGDDQLKQQISLYLESLTEDVFIDDRRQDLINIQKDQGFASSQPSQEPLRRYCTRRLKYYNLASRIGENGKSNLDTPKEESQSHGIDSSSRVSSAKSSGFSPNAAGRALKESSSLIFATNGTGNEKHGYDQTAKALESKTTGITNGLQNATTGVATTISGSDYFCTPM